MLGAIIHIKLVQSLSNYSSYETAINSGRTNGVREWIQMEELVGPTSQMQVYGFDLKWLYANKIHQFKSNAYRGVRTDRNRDIRLWERNVETRDRPAMLQLGNIYGFVLLIRLCFLEALLESVIVFLKDSDVIKVGVGIQEDVVKMQKFFSTNVAGAVDLRYVEMLLPDLTGCIHMGVKKMINIIFGVACENVHTNRDWIELNWIMSSQPQFLIDYAATDATAGADIFVTMMISLLPDISLDNGSHLALKKVSNFVDQKWSGKIVHVDRLCSGDISSATTCGTSMSEEYDAIFGWGPDVPTPDLLHLDSISPEQVPEPVVDYRHPDLVQVNLSEGRDCGRRGVAKNIPSLAGPPISQKVNLSKGRGRGRGVKP